MTVVAVIGSKRCSEEFIKTVSSHGKETIMGDRIFLDDLPPILDEFEGLIPESVLRADVILDFSDHPDILYALKSAISCRVNSLFASIIKCVASFKFSRASFNVLP